MFSPPFATAKAGDDFPFRKLSTPVFGYAEVLREFLKIIFVAGRKNARLK
jgi:hypothetical protein